MGLSPGEAGRLRDGGVETDLQPFDLAEPAVGAGLGDAVAQVLDDLGQALLLAGIDPQDWTTDAGIRCPMLRTESSRLPMLRELEDT
ncbi:hypothetical protein P3102_20180 [Amycolatopsis sp. QT-25]|uniref:hypothetical protein n=1 Tax=Amycolatopsis sp. QT-25 TaxID=3034022 RepID=UPI0023EC6EF7|nr:hypothetical protein [Amycolatopsis sp. QT-25]WET76447.1 hypothetical protein P3102_20180 [Amycolatopsis sp. QT-25]